MNARVFVKKKQQFRVEADSMFHELKQNLNLDGLTQVDLYNVYDIFNCDDKDIALLKEKVLSEKVTDEVYDEVAFNGSFTLAYECLPGQYDQRADSAQQCLMLLNNKQDVVIKSGRVVDFYGTLSEEEIVAVKKYLINPVEMREKDLAVLAYDEDVEIEEVPVLEGFISLDREGLEALRQSYGLAMTLADIEHVQNYFANEEKRDLTETELKVLDTYWSDHCRHTTFETILENIRFEAGALNEEIQKAYELYLSLRENVHGGKKVMTLMDMASICGKYMRKNGQLDDMEVSDEINACSVEIKVDVDGVEEDWLLMFKNETHNHPTEIEPFGGASTCIGGAIRDPLSGRSYVYQAMRVTGAGDITKDIKDTLANKLPQSRISKVAANGYSSYGNQIGLATTYVKEIYHDGYVAKRMEVGAVCGAAPKANVIRKKPEAGDIVVLIGGATGRDGVGGATGSSKEHNDTSLTKCSSEVQKGNAPIERKLQRLFRNPDCTRLIKKANDFGAGGVSVAVGELADGLVIDLDKVPVKYNGLSGTELAISESQERMACVIEAKDFEAFKQLAYEENLDACIVATVTEEARLVMHFQGKEIVNMSRAFLDTNGVRGVQNVIIKEGLTANNPFKAKFDSVEEMLQMPNVASQIGLSEMFDASIGKSTVLMPWGGKYQLTETEGSVQKLPVFGFTNTCSIMTHGYHPEVSEYSPYLGASYSVVEALARVTALGGNYATCRLSNQEYFERLNKDEVKWGKPTQALLGLIEAQMAFGTPAIGGKDSMSGTFNDISVPPTLITFAVTSDKTQNIISPEFKKEDSLIYLVKHTPNASMTPNYEQLKQNFANVRKHILNKDILAASTVKFGGISEALCKMSFGNKIGCDVSTDENIYDLSIGSMIVESKVELHEENFILIGKTTNKGRLNINTNELTIDDAITLWTRRYNDLYPMYVDGDKGKIETPVYNATEVQKSSKTYDKPKVIIPVFPGQNCEYDTKQQFERAGAEVEIYVFNNLNVESIERSLKELSEKIASAQILMVVGGFSSGDEPDGSGKFIANVLSNPLVNEAVQTLLANDGLILGICNGFQALIKSGLLPYGNIEGLNAGSPTLFRNDINRHVSHIAKTRIASNKSPWLAGFDVNETHSIAMSHGEGKFVVSEAVAKELFENGQVATQYVDLDGDPTMNGVYNLNGSTYAIEGITSKDGRIFGKMGHSERYEDGLFQNIDGNKLQNIFENGVNYFKK